MPKTVYTADGRELKRLSWIEVAPIAEQEFAKISKAQTKIHSDDKGGPSIEIGSLSLAIDCKKDEGQGPDEHGQILEETNEVLASPSDSKLSIALKEKSLNQKSDTPRTKRQSGMESKDLQIQPSDAQSLKSKQPSNWPGGMNRTSECKDAKTFPWHSSTQGKQVPDSKSFEGKNLNGTKDSEGKSREDSVASKDNIHVNDVKNLEEKKVKKSKSRKTNNQSTASPRPTFKPGEKKAEVRAPRRRKRGTNSSTESNVPNTDHFSEEDKQEKRPQTLIINCRTGASYCDTEDKSKPSSSKLVDSESQTDTRDGTSIQHHVLCTECRKLRSESVLSGLCGHAIPSDVVSRRKAEFERVCNVSGDNKAGVYDDISAMRVGPRTAYFKHTGCQTFGEEQLEPLTGTYSYLS